MIALLLAQIDAVPADFLKWLLVVFLAMLGAAGTVFGILSYFKKRRVRIEPQPVGVSIKAKRFNYDLAEQRHGDMTRRLDSNEAEINSIWTTMRSEDSAIREELRDSNLAVSKSLARIEGHLGIQSPQI